MCSVPSMCSRMSRTARPEVAASDQLDDPACAGHWSASEHLVGMGDPRDQVAHLPLHLGHRRDQPRRERAASATPMWKCTSARRVPGEGGPRTAMRAVHSWKPQQVLLAGALYGEHRGSRLHRHAVVEHRSGGALPAGPSRRARSSGPSSATNVSAGAPPQRHQVPALDERRAARASGSSVRCAAGRPARAPVVGGCRGRGGRGGWPCRAARPSPRRSWPGPRA